MDSKKLAGLIAATAAVAFATAPLTSTITHAATHHKCYGVNSCKGKGGGKNSCKGQGYMMETAAKCKKMGGSLTKPTEQPMAGGATNPETTTNTNGS